MTNEQFVEKDVKNFQAHQANVLIEKAYQPNKYTSSSLVPPQGGSKAFPKPPNSQTIIQNNIPAKIDITLKQDKD